MNGQEFVSDHDEDREDLVFDKDQLENPEQDQPFVEPRHDYTYVREDGMLYRKCMHTGELTRINEDNENDKFAVFVWMAIALLAAIFCFSAPVVAGIVFCTGVVAFIAYLIYERIASSTVERRKAINNYEAERERILNQTEKRKIEIQNSLQIYAEKISENHFELVSGATISQRAEKDYLDELVATADRMQTKVVDRFSKRASRIKQATAKCPYCNVRIKLNPLSKLITCDCPDNQCEMPIQLTSRNKIHHPKGKGKLTDKKKTDWGRVDKVSEKEKATRRGEIVPQTNDSLVQRSDADNQPPVPITANDVGNTPENILSNYKKNRISRKASLDALQARYDGQLNVLRHQIGQACRVEKARADVHAEQYLKELDAMHLEVLSELGLRNKETREEALLKLTDSTVERLKEVQAKDWPPSIIDETISELFRLRSRAVAEIMNELGGQPEDD